MNYENKERVKELIKIIEMREREINEIEKSKDEVRDNDISLHICERGTGRLIIPIVVEGDFKKYVISYLINERRELLSELYSELSDL